MDESGTGLETITLTLADGMRLTLFDVRLPRMVRFGPGVTTWEVFAKEAEATLHAAGLPGEGRFLRVLRVHAADEGAMTVRVGSMEWALTPDPTGHAELCWTVDGQGRIAMAEGLAATEALRGIRGYWAQRLDRLAIATPDPAFDLFVGRILPMQVLSSPDASGAGLAVCHPWTALRRLVKSARSAQSTEEWLAVTVMLHACHERCGDSVMRVRLPGQSEMLWERCASAALAVPEDTDPRTKLTHALMCRILSSIAPDERLNETRRRLLNGIDSRSWHGDRYGDSSLDLMVQCLASAAYEGDGRTHKAMRTAWDGLWDGRAGLLRTSLPTAQPLLPGLPGNGGMDMEAAVWAVAALLQQGMAEEAFSLLTALSPLRRTDGLAAAEIYRGAPNLLAGGMCCEPMEAGRAIADGGDEAAGMLYHLLVTEVLGLHRAGDVIRLTPHVPADWQDFTLTLREGASTWHIQAERRCAALTVDGMRADSDGFTLRDDGRVHQVHVPLT